VDHQERESADHREKGTAMRTELHADAAAHPAGPTDPALALLLAQGEAEAMRAAAAIDRVQRAGGGERDE